MMEKKQEELSLAESLIDDLLSNSALEYVHLPVMPIVVYSKLLLKKGFNTEDEDGDPNLSRWTMEGWRGTFSWRIRNDGGMVCCLQGSGWEGDYMMVKEGIDEYEEELDDDEEYDEEDLPSEEQVQQFARHPGRFGDIEGPSTLEEFTRRINEARVQITEI